MIPVCFALASDSIHGEIIYSVLDQKPKRTSLNRLRRVRNIVANPHVALVVDHYEEAWDRLWYILIRGQAELLEDGEERVTAIGLLRQKYDQYQVMDIDDNPVIKITAGGTVAWVTELTDTVGARLKWENQEQCRNNKSATPISHH